MVVVVTDPRLVARYGASRLEAPNQPCCGQRAQHVVDGLVGDRWQLLTDRAENRVSVRMRMLLHGREHRETGRGDPQEGATKGALEVRGGRHAAHYARLFLNASRSRPLGAAPFTTGVGEVVSTAIRVQAMRCLLQHT
jgi:hypothetical protein